MGRAGPDQCVALGKSERDDALYWLRGAPSFRRQGGSSASEGALREVLMPKWSPFHMQEAWGSRVKRDRVPFVATPKQCLQWNRKNNPRELHWPANTSTVRVKYGMKLGTDGGCKQGVVMSLKSRHHVPRPRYCTVVPLLVLAGDWDWPFGSSKLRLTSSSSWCCCPPVVAGPSSSTTREERTLGSLEVSTSSVHLFHT